MASFKRHLAAMGVVQLIFTIAASSSLPVFLYPERNAAALGFLAPMSLTTFGILATVLLGSICTYIDCALNMFVQQCFLISSTINNIPRIVKVCFIPILIITEVIVILVIFMAAVVFRKENFVVLKELKDNFTNDIIQRIMIASPNMLGFVFNDLVITSGAIVFGFYAISRITVFIIVVKMHISFATDPRLPELTRGQTKTLLHSVIPPMIAGMLLLGIPLMISGSLTFFKTTFYYKIIFQLFVILLLIAAPFELTLFIMFSLKPYRDAILNALRKPLQWLNVNSTIQTVGHKKIEVTVITVASKSGTT
uniref:G_PROTEIN_RECEP_F1_2 domain-containing protein n=1 Tax=Panagrellus redivivus TaxID=6233 RepID=A0A7E4UU18_PANRE